MKKLILAFVLAVCSVARADYNPVSAYTLLGNNTASVTAPPIQVPVTSGFFAFFGIPSSANLAAVMTDETGTGFLVFSNAPTFTGTITGGGSSAFAEDFPNAGNSVFTSSGGGYMDFQSAVRLHNVVYDHAAASGSTAGMYLAADGSGNLNYANTTESYWMSFSCPSVTLAQSTTYLFGTMTNSANTSAGRFKVYVPKSGTLTKFIFQYYGAGGSAVNFTASVYLNGSQIAATALASCPANTFPSFFGVTGLSQALVGITASGGTISAGDYLELVITTPVTMTSMTSFNFSAEVLIEKVVNNQ